MAKITTEVFQLLLDDKNSNILVLGQYVDDKTKIKVQCKKCNLIWEDSPTHLKQERWCSACKKEERIKLFGKDFIVKANKIHGDKYSYDKVIYKKASEKVIITCPIHGAFTQTPNSHLNGRGCPECAGNNFLKTTKLFIEKAKEIHGENYNYSKVLYINCKIPVEIICNTCDSTFYQTPDKHILKQGCPYCKLKSQTKLFLKLKESFPDLDILFEVGHSVVPWLGLQRFDIYIPSLNVAIEYNGEQHYVPVDHFGGELGFLKTIERDEMKRKKCKENNCKLFEIKHDYSNLEYFKLVSDLQQLILSK